MVTYGHALIPSSLLALLYKSRLIILQKLGLIFITFDHAPLYTHRPRLALELAHK